MAIQNIPLSDATKVVFDGKPVSEIVLDGISIWIEPLPQPTPTPTELTLWSDFRDDEGLPKIVFLKNATNYLYHNFHLPNVLFHNGWTTNSYPKYRNIMRSNGITPDIVVDVEYDDDFGWVIWYKLFDYNEWSWTEWDYTPHYTFSTEKDLTQITEWEQNTSVSNWSNIKFSCEPEDFVEYITEFSLYDVFKNDTQQIIQSNNLNFKTKFNNLGFPNNNEFEIASTDFVYLHNLKFSFDGNFECDESKQKLTFNETFYNGNLDIIYGEDESIISIPHQYNIENFCIGNYDHTQPGKLLVFKSVREDYVTTAHGDQWRIKRAVVDVTNKFDPLYSVDEDFGVNDDKIIINWNEVEDASSYEVRICETDKRGNSEINSVQTSIDNNTNYTFGNLENKFYKIVVISNLEVNNPEDGYTWKKSTESAPIIVKVDSIIYPPNTFIIRDDRGSPENPWFAWTEHPNTPADDYTKYKLIINGDSLDNPIEKECLFNFEYLSESALNNLIGQPGFSPGSYTAYLTAFDAYGNESAPLSLNWSFIPAPTPTPDVIPPSAPTFTSQPSSPDNNSKPNWSWSEVSDATHYAYKLTSDNGSDVTNWSAWTISRSYTANVTSNTTYKLHIKCRDSFGNESNVVVSNPYVYDTIPPSVPQPTSKTPTNSDRITWTWQPIADAVQYSAIFQNYEERYTAHNAFSSTVFIDQDLAEGTYTIKVRSKDTAGNWSEYKSHTVVIDKTPITEIPIPFTQSPTNDTTPKWTWDAISGAIHYRVHLNSSFVGLYEATEFTASSLSDGVHKIEVATVDSAGNVGEFGSHTVTIDTTPPQGGTPKPSTQNPTNDRTPTWTWPAITGATKYGVRINNSNEVFIETTSYTPSSNLSEGRHTIFVRALDSVGNWDGTIGQHMVRIDTTPIQTVPSPTSPSPTNSKRPTWTWSSIPGAVLYGVKLGNSSEITTTATNYTHASDLSSGSYTFYVRAKDSAGNWGSYGSHVLTVDIDPPGTPNVSGTTPVNNRRPTWNWNAVTGAISFKLILNGSVLGSFNSSTRSYTPTQNLSDGSHTLKVIAVDSAGNESDPGIHVITIDTISPGVPDVKGPSATNNRRPTWNWDAVSGAVNYGIKILYNTGTTGSEFFISQTSYTPSQNFSDGTYKLYVRSRDGAGNVSAFKEFPFIIDNVSPNKPVLSESNNKFTTERRPKITWSYNGNEFAPVTFEVNINFEDSWHDVGTDLEWISPVNLSDGFYTFKVRTKDFAGNTSEDDYFGFWVDNGIPETPIFEDDEFSMFTRPYFKWNRPFDVDFYECKFNGGAIFTTTSASFRPDEEYGHGTSLTMQIRACDYAGNKSSWTSHTTTIDLEDPVPPTITVKSPTNDTTPTWSWTSSPDAIMYGVKLGNMPWVSETQTSETSYTPENELSSGTHTLYVRAKDRAGNWGEWSSKSVVIDTISPGVTPSSVFISSQDVYNFKPTIKWTPVSGYSKYQIKIDNGSWISVSGTQYKLTTSIGLGSHIASVRVTDDAGNTGPSKDYTWSTKSVGTPVVQDLDCVDKTGSDWNFNWSSATGALEYEYRLNNNTPTKTNATSKKFENLSAGNYTASVRTHGGSGNYSPWVNIEFKMRTQINILSKNPMILPVTVSKNDGKFALFIVKDPCGGKFGIDWGDGVYEEETSTSWILGYKRHTYPSSGGSYDIKVYADTGVLYRVVGASVENSKFKCKGVKSWGDLGLTSLYNQFAECDVANVSIPSSIPSTVTSIGSVCKSVVYPSDTRSWNYKSKGDYKVFDALSSWNVSNIKDMSWAFYHNDYFNSSLQNWNVSNCNDFALMFAYNDVYNQEMNNWKINTSEPVDMFGMFSACSEFNKPLWAWDMSRVTRTSDMFYSCDEFNGYLGPWNMQNVTDMGWMFRNADRFNNSGNSQMNWNVTSCTDFDYMFDDSNMNVDISSWCVSHISTTPISFASDSPLENSPSKQPRWGQPC